MKTGFTRESISAKQAKLFIIVAATFSLFYAFMTSLALARGVPGVTRLNLLDIALCITVAVGILLRRPTAAWIGLVYCGVNGAWKTFQYPEADPWKYITAFIMYGMAIISIGLYPARPRSGMASPSSDSGTTDTHSGSHEAV